MWLKLFGRRRPSAAPKTRRQRFYRPVLLELEPRLAPSNTRFAVIAEYGQAGQNEQNVANLVHSWNPDFIATAGDNNYPSGAASTIDANIGQYYQDYIGNYTGSYGPGAASNKFWPALGDHDWGTAGVAPYLNYFTLPGNKRYYDYTQGIAANGNPLVELFAVDGIAKEPDGTSSTSKQAAWLQSQLAASTAIWKLVYFEVPAYASDAQQVARLRWPFQAWGASAVISASAHNYERLVEDNNFPYFVDGLGGGPAEKFATPVSGSEVRFYADFGAMLVNANDAQVTFQFITRANQVIDTYTIYANPNVLAPAAPSNLTATAASSSQINLAWTDNSSNETGFQIQQSTDGTNFTTIATVSANVNSYNNTDLTANSTYYYRVLAYNNVGNSAFTNVASTVTTVLATPMPPNSLTGSVQSSSAVNLFWAETSTNVTGYKFYRSTDGINFTKIGSTGAANSTAFNDSGLTANTTYYYRVLAYNDSGNSNYSNVVKTLTAAPAAPSNLTATVASTNTVNLAWTDNSFNEGESQIQRSKDGSNFSQIGIVGTGASTYSDIGLAANTQYYYRVVASNGAGNSNYSNQVTTLTTAPAAPSNLNATVPSATTVNLTWTDNSINETAFSMEQSSDGANFTQIGTVGANVTSYSVTGLTANQYYYRVLAYNGVGNSAYSNVATNIPAAPGNLTVTVASTTSINLAWTETSTNQAGFSIEQSADGTNFTPIGTSAATSTSISGLTPNTQYYYRVLAYNSMGNSGYSNVVTTLTAAPAAPSSLTATATSASTVSLAWTDNSINETGFSIEQSTDSTNFTPIATTAANVTSYNATGLAANTQYYYRVLAFNGVGNSAYTNVASTIPAAPTNLTATVASTTSVNLAWTETSTNVTGFSVEQSTDATNFTPIATTTATSAGISGLTPNTRYYFRVLASNGVVNSGYSNVVMTLTAAPADPTNLTATVASSNTVNLAWTDNSFNETGFSIEQSADGSNFAPIASAGPGAISSAITGLSANTQYYFRVLAYNGAGNSNYTNVVTTLTAAPAAPSNLTATVASVSSVNLAWTDNSINETGFSIEQSTDGTNFTPIATVAAHVTSYNNSGLTANTQYYYRVLAYNGVGNSSYSNVVTTLTAAPAAPSGLTATVPAASAVNLAWTDNSINETGFSIEQSSDGTNFTSIASVAAKATSYSVTGLPVNTQYYFRVLAYNGVGNSRYTNVATNIPAAPSNLTATVASTSKVTLAWTDNSINNETGFSIEKSTDGNNFTQIATVAAGVTSYINSGLTANTQYYYRVRAYNVVGKSDYSNVVTTLTAAPAAPSNLTAAVLSNTGVKLTWTNNAINQTGFKIQRSTDGVNFTQIVTLGANVTSYTNSGLTANTTYYYRILAYNGVGNSGFSNVVTTITAAPAAPSGLSAAATSSSTINLSWTDNSINETGFRLQRSADGVNFPQIAVLGAKVTSFGDSGLAANTKYYYRLLAYNGAGNSSFSNVASATTSSS